MSLNWNTPSPITSSAITKRQNLWSGPNPQTTSFKRSTVVKHCWRHYTRLIANPSVLVTSCVYFQLRPLPSTGITRLLRYYGPPRHPNRPGLALASCRLNPNCNHRFGLPSSCGGSAPALYVSRPAQRLLTLPSVCSPSRLNDPLHRRLQTLRYLCRCSDCYWVERTSSRVGIAPTVDQRLSRRTQL